VLSKLRTIVPGKHYGFDEVRTRSFNSTEIACTLWAQGQAVAGTWAEAYCAHRGITGQYDDLRFHPRCPMGRKPRTVFLPALLVGVREGREIKAVQRIFLKSGGQGYTAKRMIGNPQAGSWQSQKVGRTMALAEGFETAARFGDLHGIPTWSSLGAARLGMLRLPATIDELIIAEDNDAEGRRASLSAIEAYARDGLTIRRMPPPPPCKDWAAVPDIT
jgi:hypothetical protein